jgi:hypothetical protein
MSTISIQSTKGAAKKALPLSTDLVALYVVVVVVVVVAFFGGCCHPVLFYSIG